MTGVVTENIIAASSQKFHKNVISECDILNDLVFTSPAY